MELHNRFCEGEKRELHNRVGSPLQREPQGPSIEETPIKGVLYYYDYDFDTDQEGDWGWFW